MSNIKEIIESIYNVLLFVSFVIGVFKFKKLTKLLRFVFLFVVFGILTEITIDVLKEFGMINTMPVGNIYIPLSFLILGVFYFFVLENYVNKKVVISVVIAFELLCIINFVFIQNIMEFPNITAAVGALIVIVFAVLLFSKVMSEAKIEKLSKEPLIWINTAFLIYYSGNFFFYVLFNQNMKLSHEFAMPVANFYVGVNALLYALISIGFLKVRRQ